MAIQNEVLPVATSIDAMLLRERILHDLWPQAIEAIVARYPALSRKLAAILLGDALYHRVPPPWFLSEIAEKTGIPAENFSVMIPQILEIAESIYLEAYGDF